MIHSHTHHLAKQRNSALFYSSSPRQMAGLYGTGRSKFVAANANIIVDNATLVDIALSAYAGSGSTKSGGGEISISRTSCKGNEVDVALKWAAPSVDFPNTDGQVIHARPNGLMCGDLH